MENKANDTNKEKEKERKIAEIEKQIWKVWDILRKEGLGTEDTPILLLLLSLYKEGKLEEFLGLTGKLDDNKEKK